MSDRAVIHIVDDEDAVRASLAALLELHGFSPRVYQSGNEFLSSIDDRTSGCALVDFRMPGLDGIGVLQKMAESNLRLPVIMMTGFGEVATAVKAMKAGAADFLEKPLDQTELLVILNRLSSQSQMTADTEARRLQAQERLNKLTDRERDVFNALIMGKTNKSIGLDLSISPRTVEIHRAHLMAKLEASTLSDVVRLALTLGIRR